jgi:hypothetical protein
MAILSATDLDGYSQAVRASIGMSETLVNELSRMGN